MNVRMGVLGVVATIGVVLLLSNSILAQRRFRPHSRVQTQSPGQAPGQTPAQETAPVQVQWPIQNQAAVQDPVTAPVHATAPVQGQATVQGTVPVQKPPMVQAHAPGQFDVAVDPKLPEYIAVQAGTLRFVGSDTMKQQITSLAEGFRKYYPNVTPDIESKGSSSGPPALLDASAHFAPMSRGMNAREVNDFRKKFGYAPVSLPTSIDMISVYVHKDNPLKGITLQQVDAVFSRDRKGGYAKAINTWGDLGLQGEWANKPIVFYGRNSASGTYRFFLEHALFNGDFRAEIVEQ